MKARVKELGDKNLIGKKVAEFRKSNLMTQKVLMAKMQVLGVDINYTSLSKLEGQTRIATDKELLALSKIFAVDMEQFFCE